MSGSRKAGVAQQPVALALSFEASAQPIAEAVTSLSWHPEALAAFSTIQTAAQNSEKARSQKKTEWMDLPFARLRTSLLFHESRFVVLDRAVGLKAGKSDRPRPFAYLQGDLGDAAAVRDGISSWIEGRLGEFVQNYLVDTSALQRLRDLQKTSSLLKIEKKVVQLLPWGATAPEGYNAFVLTPGHIAKLLQGQEVFEGLGPLLRIVSEDPNSNTAELMTAPMAGGGGKFSLVCKLSLETLPGAAKAIVFLKFSRRRWASSWVNDYVADRNIGGYVIAPRDRPHEAFRFNSSFDYSTRKWSTHEAYNELMGLFQLDQTYRNESILEYPAGPDGSVEVLYKAQVTEQAKHCVLDAGVSASDQLDASRAIVDLLKPLGFALFSDFEELSPGRPSVKEINVLKPGVVLQRLCESKSKEDAVLTDAQLEERVMELTRQPISYWFGKKLDGMDARMGSLPDLVRSIVSTLGVPSETDRRHLYVLMETPEAADWIKSVVRAMVGDEITVVTGLLPVNVHGPKHALPGSDLNDDVRYRKRVEAWEAFVRSSRFESRPMFLVQARAFYEDANGAKKQDDSVNKIAGRRALASAAQGTVQYLIPPSPSWMRDYLLRLQLALLDLRYGHAGCVMGARKAVDGSLSKQQPIPEILAGIRFMSAGDRAPTTIAAATRVDLKTGLTYAKLAHQEAMVVVTDWMPFDKALAYLAARSKISAGKPADQRLVFQALVKNALDSLAELDPGAIVFVDSTHGSRLWPWLTDRQTNPHQVSVGSEQTPPSWNGLRVVRVRDQAPLVILEKTQHDERGQAIRWATPVARLFEINGTAAPTFWSVAKPITHAKRGLSCYRSRRLPKDGGFAPYAPEYSQHQTPNPVEFTVLRCRETDDPRAIARLCHHLRAGIPQARGMSWVKTVSPLHIMDKLTEYMQG